MAKSSKEADKSLELASLFPLLFDEKAWLSIDGPSKGTDGIERIVVVLKCGKPLTVRISRYLEDWRPRASIDCGSDPYDKRTRIHEGDACDEIKALWKRLVAKTYDLKRRERDESFQAVLVLLGEKA